MSSLIPAPVIAPVRTRPSACPVLLALAAWGAALAAAVVAGLLHAL